MADKTRLEQKSHEIEELVQGWGKLLAEQTFPEGVGLDVDLMAMEEFAVTAAKALVRGEVQTMTAGQAVALGEEHAYPGCGKSWRAGIPPAAAADSRRRDRSASRLGRPISPYSPRCQKPNLMIAV